MFETDDLLARIKKVYPSGMISDINWAEIESADTDVRFINVLNTIAMQCPVEFCFDPFDKLDYNVSITEKVHPAFEIW